eukprot:3506349-Alexandrium_andersonii.AAC.1
MHRNAACRMLKRRQQATARCLHRKLGRCFVEHDHHTSGRVCPIVVGLRLRTRQHFTARRAEGGP